MTTGQAQDTVSLDRKLVLKSFGSVEQCALVPSGLQMKVKEAREHSASLLQPPTTAHGPSWTQRRVVLETFEGPKLLPPCCALPPWSIALSPPQHPLCITCVSLSLSLSLATLIITFISFITTHLPVPDAQPFLHPTTKAKHPTSHTRLHAPFRTRPSTPRTPRYPVRGPLQRRIPGRLEQQQ